MSEQALSKSAANLTPTGAGCLGPSNGSVEVLRRLRQMEGRTAAVSLQFPDFLHYPLLFPHSLCRGLGGSLSRGYTQLGELGMVLFKAKAAVYKHLDLQVIWVTICFTMELFTLQMIHLLHKRFLQVPGDGV